LIRYEPALPPGFSLTPQRLRELQDTYNFPFTLRDVAVVWDVYVSRSLTSHHIQRRHFSPNSLIADHRCRRRLHLLTAAGFLARDEIPTKLSEPRLPYVYYLYDRGRQLLSSVLGVDIHEIDWNRKDNVVSELFLRHRLRVHDVQTALAVSARRNGWSVSRWITEHMFKRWEEPEHVSLETEFTTAKGEKRIKTKQVGLEPDGYLAIRAGRVNLHRFIEADRSTVTIEATRDNRRSVKNQFISYLQFYNSGAFHKRYQARGMRVLYVTTSDHRAQTFARVAEEAGCRDLVFVSTFSAVAASDPLTAPIWQIAGKDGEYPIISE
jgi:Replication-relaxation